MPQCKFSLYLKKAGLASRNIVHFLKKVILRCTVSVFAFIIIISIIAQLLQHISNLLWSVHGSQGGGGGGGGVLRISSDGDD